MKTLIEQLRSNIEKEKDRTALIYKDRMLTREGLYLLSSRIAARVIELGGKKESIVPILLPRGPEYIASELGILMAGAAFAPLSVEYPAERVDYIKKDSGCPFLIDSEFIEKALKCEPVKEPVKTLWQDAAMVIYTSGSTGNPKGIVHDHYSFTRAITRQLPIGCGPDGIELSVTPFNFAISVADIFVPLWAGAPIVILSEEDRKDIRTIDTAIREYHITASVVSPQLLKRLPDHPSTLENICCGGERISGLYRSNGLVRNSYGLSETLSVAISYDLDQAYDNTPVGKPLADFTVYLLGSDGQPVANGEEGEICIAGPLARGYLNLPEQTARTFVENPFAESDFDTRMFRTGDIGKMLPDGNILYVNRKDWMVKINGQRVEMGEIEIQLGKIKGIETAVVKSFEDENGQTFLCGYYKCSVPVSEKVVRNALKEKFPGYMIPRFLLELEVFPLNANGKLDRKILKAPEASQFKKEYAAPENSIQEKICKGFEAVLGVQQVGLNDDFFEMGGDSIKVVVLQEALSELSLSSNSIFEGRTPGEIAERVGEARKNRYAGMNYKRKAYPMTDSQLGIYLECAQAPESIMYNNPARFRFPVEMCIVPDKMKKALETVVNSFPFMKIHVEIQKGAPAIVPNDTLPFNITLKEAGEMNDDEMAQDFIKPFDLATGPLFRFALYIREKELVLMMDMHHLITDGASTALFLKRVVDAYEGRALPLEEVNSFTLCNYEENIKKTPEYAESKAYFDAMLAGVEADSNLIPDEGIFQDKNSKCKVLHLKLSDYLDVSEIEDKVKTFGITESSLFLSAFAYTLAKTAGQNEALFCTVDNGRHVPELKNTLGMLVRTLPIYAQIDEEASAADYMAAMQDRLFQSMKYDACSFVELASEYSVNSDIIFVYQGSTLNGIEMAGRLIPLEMIKIGDSMANFSLDVLKHPGDYDLAFEYRTGLYTENTIERFGQLMVMVLKGLLKGGRLRDMPLAAPADLLEWQSFNDNSVEFDRSLTMVDLFRRQFTQTPDRKAIVFKDHTLTYRELDDLSERLAVALAKLGVEPEIPVGIMVNRSEIFPVCTVGVLKAGGICQPLDANYPEERLRYMLEDSGAQIVVMDEGLEKLLPGYEGKIIYTSRIKEMPLDQSIVLKTPEAHHLFALLYTSGSTGKPKGCMLTHANLVNFCLSFQQYFDITCEDRASAYGSFGFDASMQDIYPYLTKGACVFIVPEETRLDLVGLNDFLLSNKITMSDCTTQLGRQYVCQYPDNPYLRALTVGGEKLVPCEPPNYPFINTYGPTEATIYVTNFRIDKSFVSVPIGRSFGNCDIYIVDKYLRAMPAGVPGELCIAGYPVTRGYLNRPDLTAEKYVDNPFNETPGYEKMYLTGDVCRYLPDGNIQFVGRRDEQVKIRGFRIELTEIERRIRAFHDIKDACVAARELPAGGKTIVAYVVSDHEVDTAALDAFILETLPKYMVPSATVQIDAIPLNPNGKIDKRRLPEPTMTSSRSETGSKALNCLEKEITAIIAELTGQEDFGIDVDLLSVGLSSLSMIMLSTRLYECFGCRISVSELMDGGSVLTVENAILKTLLSGKDAGNNEEEVHEELADGSMPLSSAQLGVYYDAMKRPEALIYNIPMCYSFGKNIDAEKLTEAVKQVIKAHPVLSVHLKNENGDVVQAIDLKKEPETALLEMSEEAVEDFKKHFAQPFDLFEGPLYRTAVVKTESGVFLLFDVHHIIFDGLSLSAFLAAVRQAYESGQADSEAHHFFESIKAEKECESGEGAAEAIDYYDRLFKEFERPSEIPANLSGREEEGQLRECIAKADAEKVEGFCREQRITPAQLFLSAAFYTVARYTAESRVYFSMISSGREDISYQDSFGMFVKTLPLTSTIKSGELVHDFIRNTGKAMRNAIEHSIYPFIGLTDRYGYTPAINYACQLGLDAPVNIGGSPVLEEVLTQPLPKFKISIHIETRNNAPAVCIQYNDALYNSVYMQGLADAMAVCVKHMMETPEAPVTGLSLLTSRTEELVEDFSRGETANLENRIFHQCFERQAALYPDRTALTAVDGSFTYEALDRAMNRVANGLMAEGIKPGERVLILLPRTSRLIMAMYGVLKAGAVYIPCDPDYPAERIRRILEDSGARTIITTHGQSGFSCDAKTLDIETLLAFQDDAAPQITLTPEDLAYIIYTSGSTGKPKGVMLTHGSISNYVACHPGNRHVYALVKDARAMVSVTTVSFDMSLKETAVALCNGLELVLANEDEANNPLLLAALFERTGGDAFNATPSRMAQYIALPAFCKALSNCKVVLCGGEKYSDKLLERLKTITKGRLFNTYGPTEITVSSNAAELTNEAHVSVGKPLLNVYEFIVDGNGNEVPPGVVGELYVGGAGVARGYINQEALTQKSFVPYRGMRVYKTGDYAKWSETGEVIILGRRDNQVKLRGLRIELGEIERVLLEDKHIREAEVQIRQINGTDHLCAWFTADAPVETGSLKRFLAKSLTAYMVPTAYCQLDIMPVTPNGKTDKKALPTPELARTSIAAEPQTRNEAILCRVFAQSLNLETVGATDNFFELGGTSLLVTGVLVKANKQGLTISYGDVFAHPTPRKLAAMLEKGGQTSALDDVENYDYKPFDRLLTDNTLEAFGEGHFREIGNLLLTGATGFLGIHVLYSFLKNAKGTAYCLMRGKKEMTAEARLKAQLFYYFEDSFDSLFGSRIRIVEGDVTTKDWIPDLKEGAVNTVINCAALVKHFASGNEIEDVNVGGVANLIEYCRDKDIRLIQISTGSVAGDRINGVPSEEHRLDEQHFYFGQDVENQYVHSKFMAERLTLEAIAEGMDAKIMRVGNLAARETDGEFQINFTTNGFAGRLRAYCIIGAFPYSAMNTMVEMAPIDSTAEAILKLAETPKECCIFHPYNNHYVPLGDIILQMRRMGMQIELAEDAAYEKAVREAQDDPEKAKALTTLLAYENMDPDKQIEAIGVDNEMTTQALYRLGFEWPMTSRYYMDRFLNALDGFGFFSMD